MDQAKAVINLKEGTIQLEGPVEFVEKYLDMYQPTVRRSSRLAKRSETAPAEKPAVRRTRRAAAEVEVAQPGGVVSRQARRPAKRSGRRVSKRLSCADRIRSAAADGFFSAPKSMREVKNRLVEQGVACHDNSVRIALRKLSETGVLAKSGAGRGMKYRASGEDGVLPRS